MVIIDIFGDLFNLVNNILEALIADPIILIQIISFSIVFIFLVFFIHRLFVKKRPTRLYSYHIQDEKKFVFIVIALCIGISILWNLYFFSFTTDDAFITFRYSKNLVNGYGIVFNRDNNPVEGYSNFLWVILSAIPIALNIEILIYTKIFSMVFSTGSIILLYKFASQFYDRKVSLFAPLLYSIYYPFHLWTIGGLETPLFVLLIISAYYFAYKEVCEQQANTSRKYPIFSIIASFLLCLTRAEGIVYVLGMEGSLLLIFLFLKKNKKVFVQRIISSAIVGILYVLYFLWRYSYYGYFFPNSYYAKGSSALITSEGIEYLLTFIAFTTPVFILFFIGAFKLIRDKKDYNTFILFIVPILINFAIMLNLEAFNAAQGFRFALPSMPFVIIASVNFFNPSIKNEEIISESGGRNQSMRIYIPLILILFLVIYPGSAPLIYKNTSFTDTNDKHYLLARWFDDNIPENTSIAYTNLGIFPYYCDMYFIDLWGLMDEYIAQEGFSAEYVLSRNPTFIIFYRFGPKFYDDPTFQANYELFFSLILYEIDQYLEEYSVDLHIFKLKDYGITNESLVQIFQ